jgi:hypothetical protein
MKIPHALLLMLLAACSATQTPPVATPVSSGITLPSDEVESVRYAEQLKAYPVGRYPDPHNPYVMHEGHTVYRAEATPRWNLNPNAPTAVPLGPTVAVADPAKQTAALTGELEQKIERQNQLLAATYEQNERLSQELQKLQDEQAKAREAVAEKTRMEEELSARNAELEKMRQRQAEEAKAVPKPTPPPPPQPSWWEQAWNFVYPQTPNERKKP